MIKVFKLLKNWEYYKKKTFPKNSLISWKIRVKIYLIRLYVVSSVWNTVFLLASNFMKEWKKIRCYRKISSVGKGIYVCVISAQKYFTEGERERLKRKASVMCNVEKKEGTYFFGRTSSCPTSIEKASPSPLRTPSSSVKLPLSQFLVFHNLERNNWVHFAPSPGEKASGYQTDRNVQVPQIHRGNGSAPVQSVHRTTMLFLCLNRIDYKRDPLLPCIFANVTRMRLDSS